MDTIKLLKKKPCRALFNINYPNDSSDLDLNERKLN